MLTVKEVAKLCRPCKFCGGQCIEVEEEAKDWYMRGYVIRIVAGCDEAKLSCWWHVAYHWMSDDKNHLRTNFAPPPKAIEEWNSRFGLPGDVGG